MGEGAEFRVFVEGERLRVTFTDSRGLEYFVVLTASEVNHGLWWREGAAAGGADLSLPAWFAYLGAMMDSKQKLERLELRGRIEIND